VFLTSKKFAYPFQSPTDTAIIHYTPAMQARQLRHEGGKSTLAISVVVVFFCPTDRGKNQHSIQKPPEDPK